MDSTYETSTQPTVGELVTQDWRKAEVFKKYGIDYCCGGKQTIEQACARKGVDRAQIESELKEVESKSTSNTHNFNAWELDFLADFIVNNHHTYVKQAIPFLEELSHKVAHVHGDHHPELIQIEKLTMDVIEELTMHMRKEEMVLFPYIKKMVETQRNGSPLQAPPFGTIANPINMMEAEHTSAGGAMESIETLSSSFTPPMEACMSYRVLFAKLQEFQQDLHQHIHLENNILFPKALKLEAELLN